MGQVAEYETPLVQIRGIFLCEGVADTTVSALTGGITQNDWSADGDLGVGTNPFDDIYLDL